MAAEQKELHEPLKGKLLVYNEGSIKRKMQRIVVTGGCGFIGSHLIDKLMEDENNEVVCVDNCYSGSKSNIQQWLGHPRFDFLRHDVTQPLFVECDLIYHLACPASPVFYQKNGIQTIKTSVIGTMNMLDLAVRTGARVLLSSTSEVYGDPEVHPQTEDYWGHVNMIGIRSCYDEGKRIAETLCIEYNRMHGTEVRIARIFNTYGPRMLENDGRVVSNFIVQALRGTPLTLYGEGTQTRSFCYVSDLVDGLIKLMNSDQMGPINLGNPGEYTIKELAETVQNCVNPEVPLVYKPLPSDDPKQRQPDITRAKKLLGWEPTVKLADGLWHTINDFADRVDVCDDSKKAMAAAKAQLKVAKEAEVAAAKL